MENAARRPQRWRWGGGPLLFSLSKKTQETSRIMRSGIILFFDVQHPINAAFEQIIREFLFESI